MGAAQVILPGVADKRLTDPDESAASGSPWNNLQSDDKYNCFFTELHFVSLKKKNPKIIFPMACPGVLDVGWNSCHSRNLAMVIIMMTERMMVAVLMKMMMTVRWPPKGKPWYSSSPRLSLGSNPRTLLHPNDGKDEHDQNHNYLVVCDAGGEKEGKLFDLGKMLN